jgi:hypothetical protein
MISFVIFKQPLFHLTIILGEYAHNASASMVWAKSGAIDLGAPS